MRRDFDNHKETDSERLRRRLQERRERLEHNTRMRINPFTVLSIIIMAVMAMFVLFFRG